MTQNLERPFLPEGRSPVNKSQSKGVDSQEGAQEKLSRTQV